MPAAKYLLDEQETERLLFRRVSRKDYDAWLAFFKDPQTMEHWVAPKELPETACTQWYDKQFFRYANGLGGMNALFEKSSGALIGHCGLLVQTVDSIQELEIGYSLLPAFWQKGYATEAARKCRDFAFANKLADSLISIISVTNFPSENVAMNNGMTVEKTTVYNGNKVNIFRINLKEN